MSERLTAEQQAEWDGWVTEAEECYGSPKELPTDRLLLAVDAELRALRAELACAKAEIADHLIAPGTMY